MYAPQAFTIQEDSGQLTLLDQPLSAWKTLYGANFQTAEGNG